MSLADQRKLGLQQIRQAFQRKEGDCGSSEVQGKPLYSADLHAACETQLFYTLLDAVAALTAKIKAMADHMRVHRKDYHSRRGLEAMLNQRKSLLQYLRRKDFDAYAIVLSRLGLRDNYMKLVRLLPAPFHPPFQIRPFLCVSSFLLVLDAYTCK